MRVALVCPGRGTYTRSELGGLTRDVAPEARSVRDALLAIADAHRAKVGRTPVSELDRRPRFSSEHLAGENAAALIFTGTAIDAALLRPEVEVVAVVGNSMGWYSALHVAGVFDFAEGLRLADTLGSYQKDGVVGGQVILPVVDAEWRRDPAALRAVEEAVAEVRSEGHGVDVSIRLGGYLVLAGDDEAVRRLLARLPKSKVGEKDYPFQLLGHSAFHTALMHPTSARARRDLAELPWRAPRTTLVDGRGSVFRPKSASPRALLDYTLGQQVVETYDFSASVRVVLREFAPDALVLLGPGDSLGGVLGQVLVAEGWNGLDTKSAFAARQRTASPIVVSLSRPEQRTKVAWS